MIGSLAYMDACLADIKNIFTAHIDVLCKEKNSKHLLNEFCKEAVQLHDAVNR